VKWPALPFDDWKDTFDTLHMELQILGKVRVALSPKEPEWAHVALYVTPRGLTTGAVPYDGGLLEVEADLIDHHVVLRTSTGGTRAVPLVARPVADFYREFAAALDALGVEVELSPMPQEVTDPIPFPDDTVHHAYEPDAAHRFGAVLAALVPVFSEYRAAFCGRVSRVQFWWGSMDLAVTRFSGEPCSPPPGADMLLRGTYDAEQMSVGWWPGSRSFPQPAFYAYAFPKPTGIEGRAVRPAPAAWNADLGEFILHYDEVLKGATPSLLVREFFDSVYGLAAEISNWDPRLLREPVSE
jgi:hypothetical protein